LEIYSTEGGVYIKEITINDSCTIRGIHIGRLNCKSATVKVVNCMIDYLEVESSCVELFSCFVTNKIEAKSKISLSECTLQGVIVIANVDSCLI
jgi:hypothetical protein